MLTQKAHKISVTNNNLLVYQLLHIGQRHYVLKNSQASQPAKKPLYCYES